MQRMRLGKIVPMLTLLCAGSLHAQPPVDSPGPLYTDALHRHGFSTDLQDLHDYLRRLHPAHPTQRDVLTKISQLGDNSFRARREAMFALSEEPAMTQVQLALAETHDDQEIRRRAQSLRKKQRAEGDFVLFAALRTLRLHAHHETVPILLPLLPTISDDYLYREAREALLASVRLENETELLFAFDSEERIIREISLVALGRLGSETSQLILERAMRLADDHLALAAAEGLAYDHPARCLPTLQRLLFSAQFPIRHQAAMLLQSVTHQHFGYAPYAEQPQREQAAQRWKEWIETSSRTSELVPLRERPQRSGRILLCLFRPFTVAEIDESGNFIFHSTVTRAACGGEAFPANGHRFFADWERKSILELDAYGQVVKELKLPGIPNSLHLLDNGHMLTGIYNKNLVCEIAADGTTVWEADVEGQPSDARRLSNGNTLIAINNRHRVVEIDSQGELVWQLEGDLIRSPESARRLENGNTLVACGREGCVKEFDPEGRVVWAADELPMAYDAILLDNGHLLIGYQAGLREVDRGGNVIRELPVGVVRRMHRY